MGEERERRVRREEKVNWRGTCFLGINTCKIGAIGRLWSAGQVQPIRKVKLVVRESSWRLKFIGAVTLRNSHTILNGNINSPRALCFEHRVHIAILNSSFTSNKHRKDVWTWKRRQVQQGQERR